MGSAFTPVVPRVRQSSPMPGDGLLPPGATRRPSKRTREASDVAQGPDTDLPVIDMRNAAPVMTTLPMSLEKVEEESDGRTLDTVPDHLSTSASEASSRGSTGSQAPPLLDFIGNACMASAWFTSCFPCAVVDINDSDDYVVDKLSRESAMNVMYGNGGGVERSGGSGISASPLRAPRPPPVEEATAATAATEEGAPAPAVCGLEDAPPHTIGPNGSDQDRNLLYVPLPSAPGDLTSSLGGDACMSPLHSMPSVIQEGSEETESDGMMEDVSLNDEDFEEALEDAVSTALSMEYPLEKHDSGIVNHRASPALEDLAGYSSPPAPTPMTGRNPSRSPPKKKFSVKRMFGRKKKA